MSRSTTTVPVNRVLNFCTILTLTRLTSCTTNAQRHFLFFSKKSPSCPSVVKSIVYYTFIMHRVVNRLSNSCSCNKSGVLPRNKTCTWFRRGHPSPRNNKHKSAVGKCSLSQSPSSHWACTLLETRETATVCSRMTTFLLTFKSLTFPSLSTNRTERKKLQRKKDRTVRMSAQKLKMNQIYLFHVFLSC